MIIILVVLITFFSISIDYILKLKVEKDMEEKILKQAIHDRNEAFGRNKLDFTW
jgi:hypothetical protein